MVQSHRTHPSALQRGFTLIEVLIALAILSIALTAIIKITAQNIKDTTYLQDRTIAHWVGLQILNETRADVRHLPTQSDAASGETLMLGMHWTWQLRATPTPNPRIMEIEVSVFRPATQTKLTTLTGYHYVSSAK